MSTPPAPQDPPVSHHPQYAPPQPPYPAAYPAGQPNAGQPQSGQPPHPAGSMGPVAGRPAGERNRAGLISVIFAGVLLLTQLVSALAQAAVIGGDAYEALGALNLVFGIIDTLLALGAIIFGAIGLAAKGKPKGLAGIGLGAGVTALFTVIVFSGIYPIAIQIVSSF